VRAVPDSAKARLALGWQLLFADKPQEAEKEFYVVRLQNFSIAPVLVSLFFVFVFFLG